MSPKIPFNKPFIAGKELYYIAQAVTFGNIGGDGHFTQQCCRLLEERFGIHKVLLTPSCTAALEMAAMLCDLRPGDEVILPSFTFVSTANCVRPAWRPAGLRRHPAGHAQHRRRPDRGGDHGTDARDLSRSTTPVSAARWTGS